MKIWKNTLLALIAAVICFSASGCGILGFKANDLKDAALAAVDNAMRSISKNSLTRKYRLVGDKREGENAYTGSYEAAYDDFTGKEILFGATALNIGEDIKIKLEYNLDSQSGECFLFSVSSGGISIIASRGSGSMEFDVKPGDNYIIFQGDHYTGGLSLVCEELDE